MTHPSPENVLVSTDWVAENVTTPNVRIVESNEDPLLYRSGHIPGAVEVDWTRDLNDPVTRDYINAEAFSRLMSKLGINRSTTVVLYGDRNNWWAAYSFWVFKLFQHPDVRLMDGGRLKWQQEGRPLSTEKVSYSEAHYGPVERAESPIRAKRDDVFAHLKEAKPLIDVRSPEEYSGERLHMEEYPNEGALRGGHIPTAFNIPWARAVDAQTGMFKPRSQLEALYREQAKLKPGDDVIVYCRIGERSSHTWFVLKYLLGLEQVRNYDGSWTEWGNLVGAPIEK